MELAILSAIILSVVSASFGAITARFFWAEDLEQANKLDAIRSQTEAHLRSQIESLKRRLELK